MQKKKKRNKDKNPQKSQILPCSVFKGEPGNENSLSSTGIEMSSQGFCSFN